MIFNVHAHGWSTGRRGHGHGNNGKRFSEEDKEGRMPGYLYTYDMEIRDESENDLREMI